MRILLISFFVCFSALNSWAQNWELFRLDHINYYFPENTAEGVIVDAGLKIIQYDDYKLGFHYTGSYGGEGGIREQWITNKCGAKKYWDENAFGFKGHFTSLDSINKNSDFQQYFTQVSL